MVTIKEGILNISEQILWKNALNGYETEFRLKEIIFKIYCKLKCICTSIFLQFMFLK